MARYGPNDSAPDTTVSVYLLRKVLCDDTCILKLSFNND